MRLIILFLALFLFSCTFNTSVDMPDEKMEAEATAVGGAPTSSGSERFRLSSGAGPKAIWPTPMRAVTRSWTG